jgi:hypothetical protein
MPTTNESKRMEEQVSAELAQMEKDAAGQPGIYDLMVAYGEYDNVYESLEKAYSLLDGDQRRITTTAST